MGDSLKAASRKKRLKGTDSRGRTRMDKLGERSQIPTTASVDSQEKPVAALVFKPT